MLPVLKEHSTQLLLSLSLLGKACKYGEKRIYYSIFQNIDTNTLKPQHWENLVNMACTHNQEKILNHTLNLVPFVNNKMINTLRETMRSNDNDLAKIFINNLNFMSYISDKNTFLNSLFNDAIKFGNENMVKFLLITDDITITKKNLEDIFRCNGSGNHLLRSKYNIFRIITHTKHFKKALAKKDVFNYVGHIYSFYPEYASTLPKDIYDVFWWDYVKTTGMMIGLWGIMSLFMFVTWEMSFKHI